MALIEASRPSYTLRAHCSDSYPRPAVHLSALDSVALDVFGEYQISSLRFTDVILGRQAMIISVGYL
ncbi:hypothetical protein [Methylobacterium oxalidis]|uniref:hypothetical protein n=1 Tax=Methylobacterium oxalidis TaxID=944322 RepID=UPI003315AB05